MLVSALKAIEQVGVEEVCDATAIYGVLQAIVAINNGKCLPQIEDKLRTATSALRFCIDSGDQISQCVSPGSIDSLILRLFLLACGTPCDDTSGTVAAWPISDGLLAFMGQSWQVRLSALLDTFYTHTVQHVSCC